MLLEGWGYILIKSVQGGKNWDLFWFKPWDLDPGMVHCLTSTNAAVVEDMFSLRSEFPIPPLHQINPFVCNFKNSKIYHAWQAWCFVLKTVLRGLGTPPNLETFPRIFCCCVVSSWLCSNCVVSLLYSTTKRATDTPNIVSNIPKYIFLPAISS